MEFRPMFTNKKEVRHKKIQRVINISKEMNKSSFSDMYRKEKEIIMERDEKNG